MSRQAASHPKKVRTQDTSAFTVRVLSLVASFLLYAVLRVDADFCRLTDPANREPLLQLSQVDPPLPHRPLAVAAGETTLQVRLDETREVVGERAVPHLRDSAHRCSLG